VLAHGLPLENAPSGFWPFLEEFWWPKVENKLTHEMICVATDLRCADMLSSGVTTFYDCTEAPNALPGVLSAQKNSVLKSGIRGILSFEATERISRHNGKQGLRENANFVSECCEEGGLISGLMCVHTTFTCSPEFIKKAYDMACDLDVSLHLHVSEGMYEPEFTMRKYGMKPFHFYDSIGVAGPRLLASQCVHLGEDEKEIIAEKGVRVSHQPLSNCEVGGGIAPIPDLHKLGVTMGLGSDGYIDDFFEVMRGAFLIHKAYHQDPRVMSAPYVWYLATEGGARALGFEKLGRIEPGWSADLQLIDGNLPTPINEENLYEQLVLYRSAGDVQMVMVGGRIRVQESRILDIDYAAFQERARTEAEKLWSHARE
jgi:cytosine/adenosine deaminase-related metal-dependent hydrolase